MKKKIFSWPSKKKRRIVACLPRTHTMENSQQSTYPLGSRPVAGMGCQGPGGCWAEGRIAPGQTGKAAPAMFWKTKNPPWTRRWQGVVG